MLGLPLIAERAYRRQLGRRSGSGAQTDFWFSRYPGGEELPESGQTDGCTIDSIGDTFVHRNVGHGPSAYVDEIGRASEPEELPFWTIERGTGKQNRSSQSPGIRPFGDLKSSG